jgi:RND superfamily putative drug exporter
MFQSLGRYAARHPWPICVTWLVVGVVFTLIAPKWDSKAQDDDIRFLPERCDSVRGYRLLEQAFPQDVFASKLVLAVERTSGPLTDRDYALVNDITTALNTLRQDEPALQINKISSHTDPLVGPRLVSADKHCTLIQIALGTPYLALQTRATVDRADEVVKKCVAASGRNAPKVYATGQAGVGRDLIAASAEGLDNTTIATVLLVIVILLAVYRAPLLALVPLATIAVSVWVALKILALCTLVPGFYLLNISQIFAIVMLYGAGTDYCLFLISRYREELGRGHERDKALARSVGSVGGALTASAATVICGLGLMALAEFAKVRCGGPAIAVSLAVALIASLTLAPALLRLLDKAVFWPVGVPAARTQGDGDDLWNRLSRGVVARPMTIWSVSVVLLLPLAFLGFRVKANYRATGELSPMSSSVRGLDVIQHHFTAGEVGPVTVLLESPTDWATPQGRAVLEHLSAGFAYLDNVAEVRSLTQPLGPEARHQGASARSHESPPPAKGFALGSLLPAKGAAVLHEWGEAIEKKADRLAADVYQARITTPEGARFVTRLDVVLKTDPFDPHSVPSLDLLRRWVKEKLPGDSRELGEVHGETYGIAVNARDLAAVTESDRQRINGLVLAGIFLILMVVVRKPWLAGYLLVTVLFSYFATLGATTLMAHWWTGRPLGEVDWRVPFFLFTILIAVGEDYNILLITRTLDEKDKRGADEGTRRALAKTGGTITSCGLIMAGTFATLMLSGLNTLVQIGFALAFGVLLDTFVVRPFLVPAFTLWMWRQQEPPSPSPITIPLRPPETRSHRKAA